MNEWMNEWTNEWMNEWMYSMYVINLNGNYIWLKQSGQLEYTPISKFSVLQIKSWFLKSCLPKIALKYADVFTNKQDDSYFWYKQEWYLSIY